MIERDNEIQHAQQGYLRLMEETGGNLDVARQSMRESADTKNELKAIHILGLSFVGGAYREHRPIGVRMAIVQSAMFTPTESSKVVHRYATMLQISVNDDSGGEDTVNAVERFIEAHELEDCIELAALMTIHLYYISKVGVNVADWSTEFDPAVH